MESLLASVVGSIVPHVAASALVVLLARLLAIGWIREQREFRDRVDKHIEATRSYPEFRGRTEDRLRKLYEVEQKVSSLGYEVAGAKADISALRTDVKDGMRDLKAEIVRLEEKLDEIFKRAFGRGGQ